MSAISANAIPAAAPAKANGNDIKPNANKAPGSDPFAALLSAAQAPAQSAAPVTANDKSNAADDGASTQDAATMADSGSDADLRVPVKTEIQTVAVKDEPAEDIVLSKPEVKDAQSAKDRSSKDKSANDNDPASALTQLAAQASPPDANMMAQAQMASVQTAAPAQAANDDTGESEDALAADAAKSGAKPALQTPAAASQSAAPSQTPAAAAQAGITGTNNGGNKDGKSGKDAEASQKAPVKTASAANPPKMDAPQQPAQGTPAQPAAASFAAQAPDAPVQAAGAHPLSTAVEVAPQSAQHTPDVNGLAVEIAARSQSGAKQFSIRLDPPELGRVDVRLSIDATGRTEAHLTADHPDTLNLLQKDSGTLTQALRQAGLDVSQDGLNFSLRSQNGQAGNGQGHHGRMPKTNLTATRVIDAAQNASSISFTGAANGRLDIHV